MKIETYTGGFFQTNGYLFSQGGTRLAIDAPEGITDWLLASGAAPDALLLTHLHYDHVIDAARLRREFRCPVFAHSAPDPGLTLQTLLEEVIGWPFDLEPFAVDGLLAGVPAVEIGGVTVRIDHVPGHSPDSLCFRPQPPAAAGAPGAPVVFGGDVLFREGIGRTDFPHGDFAQLIEGIQRRLFRLPDDTRVFPGHGPETTIGHEKAANPFLRGL